MPGLTAAVTVYRDEAGIPQLVAETDHDLFLARVVAVGEGRLKEPPLLYSSRLGWRVTGDGAREPGVSIRDQLLERLERET